MHDELPQVRIGDAERDEASQLLQEHMAAGRLDPAEFDDRVSRALTARTRGDLDALFTDLPGRRPSAGLMPADVPAETGASDDTPWYAQWWMLAVAAALVAATRGRLWALIPLTLVWLFLIYPSMAQRGRRALPAPSEPTAAQRAEITALVRRGEKIRAIKAYREATGADLAYAKAMVERWERELGR